MLNVSARDTDISLAVENRMLVVRADVAGENETLISYGCSGIVDMQGTVVQQARQLTADIVVAEI